jgi:signal transduction histidine kinase
LLGDAGTVEASRIATILDSLLYQCDQAERLLAQGQAAEAAILVFRVLARDIEGQLDSAFDALWLVQQRRYAAVSASLTAKTQRWLNGSYVSLFCITCVAAMMAWWVARSLKVPLRALAVGTEAISAGNLAWRFSVGQDGEIEELAGHFNRMAQELERQHHALLDHQRVLESRVAERTSQLSQRNEELRKLDKFRRQFFADISHELRTPLTVMRGEAEVTLRGQTKSPSEYRSCLQRIQLSTVQLDRLVSEMLFLAQIESGHLEFETQRLDWVELAASVVDDLRMLAQAKSIEVCWLPPRKPTWVRGDRSRLRQSMLVIGDNACRYSPAGSRVQLSVETADAEATFAVGDRGIGIPAQDKLKIFDRYYRSENARRCRPDGTGLGLPVAQAIVAAHRGRITITDRPGGGTLFCVVLPLCDSAIGMGEDGVSDS